MLDQNDVGLSVNADRQPPKVFSLEEWENQIRKTIAKTRSSLEGWIEKLELLVDCHTDFITEPPFNFFHQKEICECTRMVFLMGGYLHTQSYFFRIDTAELNVKGEWDTKLAKRLDSLLEKAIEIVEDWSGEKVKEATAGKYSKEMPFKIDCQDRLDSVRKEWKAWCPGFKWNQNEKI